MRRRQTGPPDTPQVMLSRVLEDGEAPSELRLFKAGANETEIGTFYFTAESAAAVMEAAERWGNEYSADYGHATLYGSEAPAAAWYDLEVRPTDDGPELWAVNVRWTARAAEMIEAREYRYVSPFIYSDETGQVTEFVNFALTNVPQTRNMEAIIAASRNAPSHTPQEDQTMPEQYTRLMHALGLRPDANEDAAVEAVQQLREAREAYAALSKMVPDGKDVVGTVTGWRDRAARADELEAQVASREADAKREKVAALSKQAVEDGRLTPASKDALLQNFGDEHGIVEPERLEAYLATIPKGKHVQRHAEPKPTAGSTGSAIGEDGKTEYERISEKQGHVALARLRTENRDEFDRILSEHRAARYGSAN